MSIQHRITINELVDWAENMMLEANFEEENFETIRDIISKLGLADVKAFGLTWEDCDSFLQRLGYQAQIIINPPAPMLPSQQCGPSLWKRLGYKHGCLG